MRPRATRLATVLLCAGGALPLLTCDPFFGRDTHDQTWFVRYSVENNSSVDLMLRWGSEFFSDLSTPIEVPRGTVKEIQYYEEFLGPPPDAGRSFTCISVYRASDNVLVYQLTPVQNSQWISRELREYHMEYMLELSDSKLDATGCENMCATLSGTVVDSVTTLNLDKFQVAFVDSLSGYHVMHTSVREGSEYFLMWPGDIPPGYAYFAKLHYRRAIRTVPDEIEPLGDRHYRMNTVLVPDSIR